MNNRTKALSNNAALLWVAVLGTAAIFGSYAFACVFPFAALAAIAALTLDVRKGLALVVAVFATNQIIGFALLHYPQEIGTYAWAAFIGVGALAALGAAFFARGQAALLSARTPLVLGAAILAYQAVMFVGAVVMDGFASSTPAIVFWVAVNDVAWFVGLAALRLALTRTLPAEFGDRPVRFA